MTQHKFPCSRCNTIAVLRASDSLCAACAEGKEYVERVDDRKRRK